MYFVNPYFKQILLTTAQKKKKILQIQSILNIQKTHRTNADKKSLYQYFINHPYLKEIQRSKSLRARILCVDQIKLVTEKQYVEQMLNQKQNQQNLNKNKNIQQSIQKKQNLQTAKNNQTARKYNKYKILEKFTHDLTLAVLEKQKQIEIMKQNQDHIKQKMNQLRKFSFIKNFQYHEILYLSHFIQQLPANFTKYKQFIFRQTQIADDIYFIKQGQFQIYKDIQFNKQKSLSKNKSNKQINVVKKYLQRQNSPYKIKQKKIIKQELAKIQGKCGQCFGQMQLFLNNSTRLYSFKCNSQTSSLFKINFQHFKQIFTYEPVKFQSIKKQYLQRHQKDLQKINKSKYSEEGIINIQSQITQNNQYDLLRKQNSSKLSQIIYSMDKYKTLDSQSMEGSFILPNNTIDIPVNDNKSKNYNLKRSRYIKSENRNNFKLQRLQSSLSSHLRQQQPSQWHSKSVTLEQPTLDSPFFPVINKNYLKKQNNKTQNSLPLKGVAKRRNKVKGLMDIQTIIRQKQDLFNAKSKIMNPQFSFYKIDQKNHKIINFLKNNTKSIHVQRQKSPVHSQLFMKNLIKQSLKKSGYIKQEQQQKSPNNKILNYGNVNRYKSIQLNRQNQNNGKIKQFKESNSIEKDKEFVRYSDKYSINNLRLPQKIGLSKNDFDQFFYRI